MSNVLRIRRRASGAAGAPASLENAELAYNEVDDVLYYGKGTGGAGGTASTIEAIAGSGAALMLTGNQTVNGTKTFVEEIQGDISGNAGTASALETARTISLTGDVTGSVSFDGSGNVNISTTLQSSLVTALDDLSNVAAGSASTGNLLRFNGTAWTNANLGAGDIPSLPASKINSGVFGVDRIPDLPASRVTSGTFADGRIPALDAGKVQTGQFADARISASSVRQHFTAGSGVSVAGGTISLDLDDTPLTTSLAGSGRVAVVEAGVSKRMTLSNFAEAAAGEIDLSDLNAASGNYDMGANRITNLDTPVSDSDAATKGYVDGKVEGLSPKAAVRAATTGSVTLSGTQTIDGVSLTAGDRVLVKNQSSAADNGVYIVGVGSWSRAPDADTWDKLVGAYVFATEGTTNGDLAFVCTSDGGGTLGSTNVDFDTFQSATDLTAGDGLTKSGNELSVQVAGDGLTTASGSLALDGYVEDLAGLGSNGLIVKNGTSATSVVLATSGSGLSISNGNGASGNPTFSLTTPLQALAGVTPGANRLPYFTGSSTASHTEITAFARALLGDGGASAMRGRLQLGGMAIQDANNVDIDGGTIDGITLDGGTF